MALIENPQFWAEIFPSPYTRAQIILDQLIHETTDIAVAQQLGIPVDVLLNFQKNGKNSDVFKCLSRVLIKNWPYERPTLPSITTIAMQTLQAAYNNKALAGETVHVDSFRAIFISKKDNETHEVLYGSADREKGHIPPDKNALKVLQERHLSYFKTVTQEFKSSNPALTEHHLAKLVSSMSLQTSPAPGLGKVYVGSSEHLKELKEHAHLPHAAQRVFFTDGTTPPNYVSTLGAETHESFAHTRPKKATYGGSRSYPMNPYTYHHKLPTGHIITFDRGHGCDHADTIEHSGMLSTQHRDNYTPQNYYYNEHIRNPLVNMIRGSGGAYREIAIYHPNPLMTDNVRIPEAFIFIEIYDDKAEKAYFFPNFVAYEALNFEIKHKSKYLDYLDLFNVNALIEYFFKPFIQAENPIAHMEQCNKSTIIAHRIFLDIQTLFSNLTENAFPPRSRSALIRSIMNQNVNTAAILDFQSLLGIETAINHYATEEILWALDDRPFEDVLKAYDEFSPNLSVPVQQAYQETVRKYPEFSAMPPESRMRLLQQAFGFLINKMEEPDRDTMRAIIGGNSLQDLPLAKRLLNMAIIRITNGDYNDRALSGIKFILTDVPGLEDEDKAHDLDKYFKDKNNIRKSIYDYQESLLWVPPTSDSETEEKDEIARFFTYHAIKNKMLSGVKQIKDKAFHVNNLLGMLLILEYDPSAGEFISPLEICTVLNSIELLGTTLVEKKRLADFLNKYHYFEMRDKWIVKINEHYDVEPTRQNAELIASWLREGSGAFRKDAGLAEQVLSEAKSE